MAPRTRTPQASQPPRVTERVLPHDIGAEESVLGGLLFCGRRAMAKVGDALRTEHFYDARHEAIFAAMREIDAASRPIDIITVADEMRRLGTIAVLSASGCEAYLAELANKIASDDNIREHARMVRDKARSRALILQLSEARDDGYSGRYSADEYLTATLQRLLDLDRGVQQVGYVHRRRLLHQHVGVLEKRYKNRQAVTGIPTGILEFDELTTGLQPTDFVVIGARPSMGKTAFAMGVVEHAAARGNPCLVFSLEMSAHSLLDRSLASEAHVKAQKIRTGFLESQDWQRLLRAMANMHDLPIAIAESVSPTLAELRAVCMRWRSDPEFFPPAQAGREPPVGLIVIDYLQLMSGSQRARDEGSREREISEISRGLKRLAKELGLPIVALSQLNRGVEARADKRPVSSDLRESGAIEQDADLIVFIYRDEFYNPQSADAGVAELILTKQRNGPTGTVRVRFDREHTRFDNLEEERAENDAPDPRSRGYLALGPQHQSTPH